jgi:hypothetical protein
LNSENASWGFWEITQLFRWRSCRRQIRVYVWGRGCSSSTKPCASQGRIPTA